MGPLRKTFDQLWESSGKLPRLLANLRILLPMENSIGTNGKFHWIQWKIPLDPMEYSIGSHGKFHWIQWKIPFDPMENSIGSNGKFHWIQWNFPLARGSASWPEALATCQSFPEGGRKSSAMVGTLPNC